MPIPALTRPAVDLIRARRSVRTYDKTPLTEAQHARLSTGLASLQLGPLGTQARLQLIAARAGDARALRGLGTYGFVRHPAAFVAGTSASGDGGLEDFGYLMESAVLLATDLGLGSVWLGGSFTRSRFASRIGLRSDETLPAVVAVGHPAAIPLRRDRFVMSRVKARERLPWEALFFDGDLGRPLARADAGAFATPLEMVRLAPSASNRQPWRLVRAEGAWQLLLERTPGYREGWIKRWLGIADLQRIDMGIAMCHFALAAGEVGRPGCWKREPPSPTGAHRERAEYVATWCEPPDVRST